MQGRPQRASRSVLGATLGSWARGRTPFSPLHKNLELGASLPGEFLVSSQYMITDLGLGPCLEGLHCQLEEEKVKSYPAGPHRYVQVPKHPPHTHGHRKEHILKGDSLPPGGTCGVNEAGTGQRGQPLSGAITCREKEREVAEVGVSGGSPGGSCQAGS